MSARGHSEGELDLVLVVEYFRSVTPFLSVIRYLSKEFRIGIYCLAVPPDLLDKNSTAQSQFVELCLEYGAVDVSGRDVRTRVLMVPQRHYSDEALAEIKARITARKTLGAMSFAWAGKGNSDRFIGALGIRKLYSIDLDLIEFLLESRGGKEHYEGRELVPVGLPFGKYPIFEDFEADYILAMPTPFSFPQESDKFFFLETVLQLYRKIPRDASIVFKPHNGIDRDLFSPPKVRAILKLLPAKRFLLPLVKRVACMLPPSTAKLRVGMLYTAYLYERVLERTRPMHEATPFSQHSLEAFLPRVRKGVIGGLSNTMWGASFFRIPFYNCVDIRIQDRQEVKGRTYGKKDPTPLLDLNMSYFHVPFCEGKLEFDPKAYDLVKERNRRGDLLEELRKELRPEMAATAPGP
jgi:hypothetical protein